MDIEVGETYIHVNNNRTTIKVIAIAGDDVWVEWGKDKSHVTYTIRDIERYYKKAPAPLPENTKRYKWARVYSDGSILSCRTQSDAVKAGIGVARVTLSGYEETKR